MCKILEGRQASRVRLAAPGLFFESNNWIFCEIRLLVFVLFMIFNCFPCEISEERGKGRGVGMQGWLKASPSFVPASRR